MPAVSLRRSVRLGFAPSDASGADPQRLAERETYHRDLLRPYGLDPDLGALAGAGPSYGEMGRALLELAVPPHEPVDLLVLAYAVPDLEPGRATATYLSHLCPGRPTSFAVSDQGTAAAFTGLKLIGEYTRAGDARRAVLLVVEQATLPYDPGVPVTLPTGHTGVALVLEAVVAGADAADADWQLGSVSATPNAAQQPPAEEPGTVAILGAGLDAGLDGGLSADEQRPYTGVWWQLAGLLAPDGPAPQAERVLLADFEPDSKSLCLAEFRALMP
ncbi:hypothetical protein [Actinospica robiniae]|uniref:hypothetical protein n=1 Tax=Actinospica robiniae TaxID=304901 RepID=UPI0003F52928|nr:hypothetical protein [Actinospica robiniae]